MERLRTARTTAFAAIVLLASVAWAGDAREKASSIVAPGMEVENATVETVFEQLREDSVALDPDGEGVNFLFQADEENGTAYKQRTITLDFTNMPLGDVIRYVCMAAGLHYKVEERAIIIADKTLALDKMETRFYPVAPGVFKTRPTNRAKFMKFGDD